MMAEDLKLLFSLSQDGGKDRCRRLGGKRKDFDTNTYIYDLH